MAPSYKFSLRAENRNADAVEANKASAGSQPEISVWGLLDPTHCHDAFVLRPGSVSILGNLVRGIQG